MSTVRDAKRRRSECVGCLLWDIPCKKAKSGELCEGAKNTKKRSDEASKK